MQQLSRTKNPKNGPLKNAHVSIRKKHRPHKNE